AAQDVEADHRRPRRDGEPPGHVGFGFLDHAGEEPTSWLAAGGADDLGEARARVDRVAQPPGFHVGAAAALGPHEAAIGERRDRAADGVPIDAEPLRDLDPPSSGRASDFRIRGSSVPTYCASCFALSGWLTQRVIQPTTSTRRSCSCATLGLRKLLVIKRPSAAPIRSLLFGTIPVCGMGMPNGCRNRATTANQSAQAPTMPASAKARA